MSKTAKTWMIVLSIPALLFLIIIVAAKMYFTSDRLKALIVPQMEESMHRTVSVQDISFSVFPSFALSIDNLKISNPPGSPFERQDFLSLENLRLQVKIFQLLKNKLEISYITIDHPVLYLERTADGLKNYSGDAAKGGKKTNVTVEKSGTGALLLSNLEINNGEIEYVDKKYDSRMIIDGLHQTASVEAKTGENALHIQGTTSIEKFSYGSLALMFLKNQPITGNSQLTYMINKDILSFDNVAMKIKELPLTIGGTILNLQQETLMLDLTVNSPGAQMEQLLSLVPPELLKQTKGLSSSGEVKFAMAIKGPSSETMNPGTSGTFTVTSGKIQYASLPKSITNITIAGNFDKPSAPLTKKDIGSFGLEKFSAALGSSILTGSMRMTNFDDPSITASFNGAVDLNEVKEYYPLEQGTNLSGLMKATLSLDGKAKSPQTIKANGATEFRNVTMQTAGSPKPIRDLNGTISFNNQLIESKHLVMNIGESDLSMAFSMKNYMGMVMESAVKSAGKPSATLTLTSKQLRTVDLMPEQKTPAEKTGSAKTAKAQSGMIPGIDFDANVAIDKLVTEKFTFTNAHGTAGVSGGVVNLKNFSVNAFQGTIQSKGTLDLRDPKKSPFNLDLDIKNVESNELLSPFSSFGQFLYGKFSTTAKMQGDLNDTLGLNKESLLGNGNIQILEGKLAGFPLTTKLAEVTGLDELKSINFKNWANIFSIANGRLNVKDLKVNAGATDFLVGGSQGLDGSMEYAMTVKLPESATQRLKLGGVGDQLLQLFKDNAGRVNLTFDVTGTSTSPVVKLNSQAQQEALKNKLGDDLKKKAEEGLMKLFKKP
jgi:uncharacterized protein involved in outer membrane biogenesis